MATWDYLGLTEQEPIPDEYVWARLRLRRDYLLSESDWTQLLDVPVDQDAWARYRQELRDMPNKTTGDPRNAKWPTPPA